VTGRVRLIAGVLVIGLGVILLVTAIAAMTHGGGADTSSVAAPLRSTVQTASPASAPFSALTETRLRVGTRCLRVVVADSKAERERGLMGEANLGPYDGMLFVSPGVSSDAFTMSGTLVPLDIGWYDSTGRGVGRAAMVPCRSDVARCPVYRAGKPWRFALETMHGQLAGGSLGACA
jgi:uncharacterized membrane protein (UPF0127 family)